MSLPNIFEVVAQGELCPFCLLPLPPGEAHLHPADIANRDPAYSARIVGIDTETKTISVSGEPPLPPNYPGLPVNVRVIDDAEARFLFSADRPGRVEVERVEPITFAEDE